MSHLIAVGVVCFVLLIGPTAAIAEAVPESVELSFGDGVGGAVLYHHVKPIGQKTSLWCWATAVKMITDHAAGYQEPPIRQCEVVSERVGVDCCDPEVLEAPDSREMCVKGRWPSSKDLPAFSDTQGFCIDAMDDADVPQDDWEQEEACALEWDELKEALGRGPVAFSWRWPPDGGSGHMMVATGYIEFPNGEQWVVVNDPWPPSSGEPGKEGGEVMLIPYERYLYGTYTHWRDYYLESDEG